MLGSCGIQAVMPPVCEGLGLVCRQVTEQPVWTSELGTEEPREADSLGPNALSVLLPTTCRCWVNPGRTGVNPQFQCDLHWGYTQIPAEVNLNYKPLDL